MCGTFCVVGPNAPATTPSPLPRVLNRVLFSGIFAYLNYGTPRPRRKVLDTLVNGLQRLEYRGYDSAGTTRPHFLLCFC